MTESTVTAGLIAGLLDYAEYRGADRESLLVEAELHADQVASLDSRVPLRNYLRLFSASKQQLNDPALGLRYGAEVGMAAVSVVGLIMEASMTMGEAFAQMQRFSQIAMEIDGFGSTPRFELVQLANGLHMIDRWEYGATMPELIEGTFARLVCGPRRFLQQPHVLEVCFMHSEPTYRALYQEVFQCPVHFSAATNSMRLHPDIASWPVAQTSRYVFGVLAKHADTLLSELASDSSLKATIESLMMPRLHTGDLSIEAIAKKLNMSRQTLFRKLAAQGASYTQILEGLRHRLAIDYLTHRRASVTEVAYLLGFSEQAAFTRAFKRWTGKTPSEFRHLSS